MLLLMLFLVMMLMRQCMSPLALKRNARIVRRTFYYIPVIIKINKKR